jgi:hypothetical protein
MANPMDIDDDFLNRSQAFLQWLQSSGASISDKIDLIDMRHRGAGRGVGIAMPNMIVATAVADL